MSDLEWIKGILWRGEGEVLLLTGRTRPPVGYRLVESYTLLPSPTRLRVLLPAGSPRAASASLQRFRLGMSRSSRLVRGLAGLAVRAVPPRAVTALSLRVLVAPDVTDGELAERALAAHLGESLGPRNLQLAVSFGPARPTKKPVARLLTRDGRTIGYVKVGWNEPTRQRIRHEADVLRAFEAERFCHLRVPRLLHVGPWNDLDVLVVSALPHDLWGGWRRQTCPSTAARREVAELGVVESATLCQSRYWRSLTQRVGLHENQVSSDLGEAIAVLERRHGETELAFGAWHGDFTPWNMEWHRGQLLLWDWERFERNAPLGFDSVHFWLKVGLRRGLPFSRALRIAGDKAGHWLSEVAAPVPSEPLLMCLYLLEIMVRDDPAPHEERRSTGGSIAALRSLCNDLRRQT